LPGRPQLLYPLLADEPTGNLKKEKARHPRRAAPPQAAEGARSWCWSRTAPTRALADRARRIYKADSSPPEQVGRDEEGGHGMGRITQMVLLGAAVGLAAVTPAAAQENRIFNAPPDKVWSVAKATLDSLGWKVDKEEREIGFIQTKSKRIEGEEYGVYAKGMKHRLKLSVKSRAAGKTEVGVERRVWKEERALWIDIKEEEVPTTDRTVERQVLAEIGKNL
jgi:hypothetical protein